MKRPLSMLRDVQCNVVRGLLLAGKLRVGQVVEIHLHEFVDRVDATVYDRLDIEVPW